MQLIVQVTLSTAIRCKVLAMGVKNIISCKWVTEIYKVKLLPFSFLGNCHAFVNVFICNFLFGILQKKNFIPEDY